MEKNTEITEEKRKLLSEYIEKLRNEKNLGFNQICLKIGMNGRTFNEISKGIMKKINPFHLQKLAYGLGVDYKELYKIVGYLSDEDFKDEITLMKENKRLEEELSQKIEKEKVKGAKVEIDLEGLSGKELKEVKKFVEFLKSGRGE